MEKKKYKRKPKDLALDLTADIVGSFIFAIGIVSFTQEANIAPGGVTGIALIINYLADFMPVGTLSLLLNVPLMILAIIYLGRRFCVRTLCSLVISSLLVDFVAAPLLPVYTGDRLLCSIFGGIFIGAGLGIIFLRGSTTGGTEIISYLVKLRYPHISMGRALLAVDFMVILISIAVFRDVEAGMYGVISLFCCSKVIDTILYGPDQGSMVTVVSDQNPVIAQRILEDIDRGVTLLAGKGAYTGQRREVLICAVRKNEFSRLKAIIHEEDPKAFVVVSETADILGEGFKPVTKD